MIELKIVAKENCRSLTHNYEVPHPLTLSYDDPKLTQLVEAIKKDFQGTCPEIVVKAVFDY